MNRRHHLSAAFSAAALIAAAAPAVATAAAPATAPAGATNQRTSVPTPAARAHRAAATSAKPALGTVKGKIKAAHRLNNVDIDLYERKTAEDGSKGWVVGSDDIFGSGGYGVTLNKKTGAYSFTVRPGTYRLELNGTYHSGHQWGIVAYGPGKPAAAAFGKSVKVRKGKTTKHVNVKAAGNDGKLNLPDPQSSISPSDPTPGGRESIVLGTWPHGTVWTYTWQIGNSEKYLSFKRTVTVPSTAAGKSIAAYVYGHSYGKNGSSISISTTVAN